MEGRGQILLINPWIVDFAAHNQWIEPLGLLTIAAALRAQGFEATVVDCLAPHAGMPPAHADGTGKFVKTVIPKPEPVAGVPRRFGRYGMLLEAFDAALNAAPRPDLVLVASGMSYWYPGVVEAIRQVRARYGAVPVVLGGVYATLCPDHAQRYSGADVVISGRGLVPALQLAGEATGWPVDTAAYGAASHWPAPAHDLVARSYAGLLTSWGCPYRCTYCASHRLHPAYVKRDPQDVVDETVACAARGIRHFAFYDDALLLEWRRHLAVILEGVLSRGLAVRFHTPNGLHAREIDSELAGLLFRAGLSTVRLSLETVDADRQRATGGKVTTEGFEAAVAYLRQAGFRRDQMGAYVLAGLPDQPLQEVEATVRAVHGLGIQAKLALFSPIPGTPDGDRALPAGADPLLHNNTAFPYQRGAEHVDELERIKLVAKRGNEEVTHED